MKTVCKILDSTLLLIHNVGMKQIRLYHEPGACVETWNDLGNRHLNTYNYEYRVSAVAMERRGKEKIEKEMHERTEERGMKAFEEMCRIYESKFLRRKNASKKFVDSFQPEEQKARLEP